MDPEPVGYDFRRRHNDGAQESAKECWFEPNKYQHHGAGTAPVAGGHPTQETLKSFRSTIGTSPRIPSSPRGGIIDSEAAGTHTDLINNTDDRGFFLLVAGAWVTYRSRIRFFPEERD